MRRILITAILAAVLPVIAAATPAAATDRVAAEGADAALPTFTRTYLEYVPFETLTTLLYINSEPTG